MTHASRGNPVRTLQHAPASLASVVGVAALVTGCALGPASFEDPSARAGEAVQPIVVEPAPPPAIEPSASWHVTQPEPDLWARIRAGYDMPRIEHARIESEIRWFARHPDYLDRVAARAERYLHHIVEEIETRNLPMELALLPVVESAYDPYAYSHGRAAGLWQFIPGTGRLYALEQDWWHDERRDVLESTRASLEHLDDLQAMFEGDWLLALAAYNAGPGNVRKALRRARANGTPTDFFSLSLPRETRAYVPRLLALARVIERPEDHGLTLRAIPDAPYFETVETGGQIDLARAAELAELDSETLYQLNPGLNRWATHPEGPHRLVVPVEHAERLRTGLQELPENVRVTWTRHRIQPGESLSTIASRHGTDVTTLQRANRLRGSRIRAGDALLIPKASGSRDAYALSVAQRDARRDSRNAERLAGHERSEHEVRAGESFWTIARSHGVNMRSLAAWNGMALADPLRPGQSLVVWRPTDASAANETAPATRASMIRELAYRVRRGDSLWTIARRFGLRIPDILEWNGIDADRLLQPGQQLKLFVDITGD